MYKAEELSAELARQNLTKQALADKCHIARNTFLRKARQGTWYIDEVQSIAKELHLSNERMCEIFFSQKVS